VSLSGDGYATTGSDYITLHSRQLKPPYLINTAALFDETHRPDYQSKAEALLMKQPAEALKTAKLLVQP